jgi:Rps23 Pro-64 3,4-dihydroxylase Tpa1-like proline 4-hydroxylase
MAQRLILELNPRIPLLDLIYTIEHNKIAYSTGGASLPKHLDNDGSNARDLRKLTAILYLNPTWQPSHAGQLRIHGLDGSISI